MRGALWLLLLAFLVANLAGGFAYGSGLEKRLEQARQAAEHSPQAELSRRGAELEQLRRAVEDWERRGGYSLADAMQLFEGAAVGWDEIALESSAEAGSRTRLDVVSVRGLAGSTEQLTRVDRRLAPRCLSYRRTPTRDGKFILSCQLRPKRS